MKKHIHLWIYAALLIGAAGYKVWEMLYSHSSWFSSYFEDLIALPIILKTALITIQSLKNKWSSVTLAKSDVIIITVLFSVYFEVLLPRFNPLFTGDLLDVFCYTLGGIFFVRKLNLPMKPSLAIH